MPRPFAQASQPAARAPSAAWQVRLLGAVQAHSGPHTLSRLPSRAAALLLARLALEPTRSHPREELVELLWPGVALDVGRNRLRQTLSTLKSLLEPAGAATGAVLVASRHSVSVAPGALACDAAALESALREQRWSDARALQLGAQGGEFMPGFYEEWVQEVRQRLAAWAERMPPAAAPQPDATPLPAPAGAVIDFPGTYAGPEVRLPRYLTTLFGAEPSLQRLLQHLDPHRLVTLVGPGGAGKTRLAVEAAGRAATPAVGVGFARVVFVSLVPCRSAADVLQALASALHLPPTASTSAQRVAQALGSARSLLVLDNCEQLEADALLLAPALLSANERLHVLATSRRPLGVDGEQVLELPTLALPPLPSVAGTGVDGDAPGMSPAVALFVDRARAARADFRLSAAQAPAVAELVRLLDGLPLAIELAASRVRSFSPQAMLDALRQGAPGQRLDLLQRRGPRSGVDARNASMRDVVQWSWQLLQPPQQALLLALTVLVAPFTAQAASAAHGAPAELLLDDLVGHSLVVRAGSGVETVAGSGAQAAADAAERFALYEPVLEFLRDQFEQRDARRDEQRQYQPPLPGVAAATVVRQRVRQWLLAWAQALRPGTPLAQIQPELSQLRALMRSAPADRACALTLQIALALRPWWDGDGLSVADIDAMQHTLEQGATEASNEPGIDAVGAVQRADVHELLAYLLFGAGHVQRARQHAQAALQWAGAEAAPRARALLRQVWIELASFQPQAAHAGLLQEALRLSEAAGDRATQARVLHQMSVLHLMHDADDWPHADALLQRAQALWLALGDRAKAAARQRSRAELLHRQCRWEEALAVYAQTEAQARADGDWVGLMDSMLLRGVALAGQHRWAEAARALATCAQLAAQRHHTHGLAYALWQQSRVLARLRKPEAAACLIGYASPFWQANIGPLSAQSRAFERRVQALVVAQAGSARLQAWLGRGALMTLAEAVALASTFEVRQPGPPTPGGAAPG